MTHPHETHREFDTERLRKRADELVIGHDGAKDKAIAALAMNERLANLIESGYPREDFSPKLNVLLVGTTGTGKTTLVKLLAKEADRPFVNINESDFSAAGYRGLNAEDVFSALVQAAGGDLRRARRGVAFLDDVDKIRTRNFGGHDDVGGRAVQQAFLPHLEGTTVLLKLGGKEVLFDTSGVTFFAAGAFEGLEELTDEALVRFGMIPEFVGRFPVRARLEPLDRGQLKRVLTTPTASPAWKAVNYFRHEGIDLRFDDEALDAIAELAAERETGARALGEIVGACTLPLVAGIAQLRRDGVKAVVIDEATVREGRPPWKIPGEPVYKRTEAAPLPASPPEASARRVSEAFGWTAEAILARYEAVKGEIGWADASVAALRFWSALETEWKAARPALLLRLAEEIWIRRSTVERFFRSYVFAGTANLQAVLHYHDYVACKEYERLRTRGRFRSGDLCPHDGAGCYLFVGYRDGSEGPPPDPAQLAVRPGEEFPTPKCGKRCWWRPAGTERNGN